MFAIRPGWTPEDQRKWSIENLDSLEDVFEGHVGLAAAIVMAIQATHDAIRRHFACPVCGSVEKRAPVEGGGARCPKCRTIIHAGNRDAE